MTVSNSARTDFAIFSSFSTSQQISTNNDWHIATAYFTSIYWLFAVGPNSFTQKEELRHFTPLFLIR